MSFLRKQQSRLLGPQKSPSPGLAFGQTGLSRQGRGELFHSAKMLRPLRGLGCHPACSFAQKEGILHPRSHFSQGKFCNLPMEGTMCHSCGSRNPDRFVPAAVFLLGKREL